MDKTIYHGSAQIVRTPRFGAGRQYNDFGLGFYCSEYPVHAAEWAVRRDRNGFVSAYSINMDGLVTINLCSSRYTALHWLCVLFNHREFDSSSPLVYRAREYISANFPVDYQGCDCIIGYRADNSCFALARDFLEGRISYQSLFSALNAGSQNRQFVLKSNRAFDRISFSGYSPSMSADHYPVARAAELRALNAKLPAGRGELYINQMIDEEIKPYDTRLR